MQATRDDLLISAELESPPYPLPLPSASFEIYLEKNVTQYGSIFNSRQEIYQIILLSIKIHSIPFHLTICCDGNSNFEASIYFMLRNTINHPPDAISSIFQSVSRAFIMKYLQHTESIKYSSDFHCLHFLNKDKLTDCSFGDID